MSKCIVRNTTCVDLCDCARVEFVCSKCKNELDTRTKFMKEIKSNEGKCKRKKHEQSSLES